MSPDLVLLGVPNAGKDTQASRFTRSCVYAQIAPGAYFRAETDELPPPPAHYIRAVRDRGEYVPDSAVHEYIDRSVEKYRTRPIVWNGYPRSVSQMERMISSSMAGRNFVIVELFVSDEVAISRGNLRGRPDDSPLILRNRIAALRRVIVEMKRICAFASVVVVTVDAEAAPDVVEQEIRRELARH